MPKIRARAVKPPAISKPQGEPSFRIGAPPVPGKAVTAGNFVALGASEVAVGAPAVAVGPTDVAVGAPAVAVTVGGVEVGVSVGCVEQIGPVMMLESRVT